MRRATKLYLPYEEWPEDDRRRWETAVKAGTDPFDDCGPAAHLAEPTRLQLQYAYAKFLAFLSVYYASLLSRPPAQRLDRKIHRSLCQLAASILRRRNAYQLSSPSLDGCSTHLPSRGLVWLLTIIKRITAQAKPKPEKHHLVTSDTLHALEIGLMDGAVINANAVKNRSAARALGGRCGPTPIHRRHRRGHKFVISLRVRRRPERRCWFTPRTPHRGGFAGAGTGASTLPSCATQLRKKLRSACAVPVRLPAGCGGYALTVKALHFFASSAEMAKARVSGGPPNRSAETVSKPQAFVTKAIPWRSNEVRSNTRGFRPFQPVLVFASSHHIALVQPGTGLNSSSMNSERSMMSSRDAPNSAFSVTSVGGTS